MALKFTTAENRDEFARRLAAIANGMFDAMSQGNDNRIYVNPEMAGDILTAAGVVKLSDVKD